MLVKDLFEMRGESRSEFDWNNELANRTPEPEEFMMVDVKGKVLRRGLTKSQAHNAIGRPDLVARYGKFHIKKVA